MNDHVISPSRRPIVIADSELSTGHASTSVPADDAEALLRDYLRLIRKVRNQQRARNIALRRVDIEALANHLEWSDDQVLARLADLMGATRRQRATMLAVLSTGAALITVASPMSAAASTTDAADLDQTEPPIVIEADRITNVSVGMGRPLGRITDDATAVPRRAPVLDLQADLASFSHTAARHEFSPPTAEHERADDAASHPVPTTEPALSSEPATGPDGATVAVGRAPVPPTPTGTGTDADGNTVAVGQAPVPPAPPEQEPTPAPTPPPAERVDIVEAEVEPTAPPVASQGSETGTDADGNTVAVGQAPVPPAPAGTGTDADGSTVAVGQAPVPPTPDA